MSEINTTLNDVFRITPLGDVRSSMGSTLRGINHRSTPLAVPINRDNHGYVFFTRPQLNLATENVRALRKMLPLLDQNHLSIPRAIRRLLDPRLDPNEYPCPLVDERLPFIPLLSNHIISCAGWPDPVLDLFTSKPGQRREVYTVVDSAIEINSSYPLSCSFRNMPGDPITALFDHWMWYMSSVFSGDLVPYPDFIALNEEDYNTRVWRLVMDKNKQFVQKIACCGAGTVNANPIGNSFNFESDRPLNMLNDQIQIRIECVGFLYNDPILIHEFNQTVAIFNPDFYELLNDTGNGADAYIPFDQRRPPAEYVRLKHAELALFNNIGYPIIHPDTYELMWYVPLADYNARMSGFNRLAEALTATPEVDSESEKTVVRRSQSKLVGED